MKTLETQRLLLRPFIASDAPAVYEYGSMLEVQQYTGNAVLNTVKEALDIIQNVNFKDYTTYGYGRHAVIYKPDNKLIGFAGLKYLPELDKTDIGFRFLPQYWNKGIATEASIALLDYGFNDLKLSEIIAMAYPINFGSCKVLEKIGMECYKQAPYDETEEEVCHWYRIYNPNIKG